MKIEIIRKQIYENSSFITKELIVTVWTNKYKRTRIINHVGYLIKSKYIYGANSLYTTRHPYFKVKKSLKMKK